MNSRERVLLTVDRQEPDRVPFNLRPADSHRQRVRDETGNADTDFAEHFGHDVRYVGLALPERPDDVPVADWTPHPTPDAVAACADQAALLREQGVASCSGYACGVFEQAKAWLGDVPTLTLPYDDPDRLGTILDRITAWKMAIYGAYARAGVDIVWMGDDLGCQRSLIMRPEDYRTWYRPRHAQIVDHLRAIRPDVRIAFHCCGHVTPLVPDLIDIGIDILEAVQPEAMDIARLKREFGRDITFWGGVGLQDVLIRAAPGDVIRDVRDTARILAPGGGWIAAPCHTLTDEFPWENVVAFHDAVRGCGCQ